jgi:hypothetical protein
VAAQLDLSAGPLRLDVPATPRRYYVLQFVDAWTNNFAYVGGRVTGTHAGSYWLVPPGGWRTLRRPPREAVFDGRFVIPPIERRG